MTKDFLSILKAYQELSHSFLSQDSTFNPEQLTHLTVTLLSQMGKWRNTFPIKNILKEVTNELKKKDSRLEQNLFGHNFSNPIGLAAGFDKNGVGAAIWDCFGFGFAELGTVTWHKQLGNYRPRLFRLSTEKAALNRMGFNNNGAEAVKQGLEEQHLNINQKHSIVIGINFGKSKVTALDQAYNDYASSLKLLSPLMNYGVINISSPNTPGLRDLQDTSQLRSLLSGLRELPIKTPLLLKIAPDLANEDINDISHLAYDEGLAGIIAVNTSINRLGFENRCIPETGQQLRKELGGLSGVPLQKRALEVIKCLHESAHPTLPLIGVGGIDSPRAAWERIVAGASLIQLYTGWIYNGPKLVPQILEGLQSQLDCNGFNKLSEAVGSRIPWTEEVN
uniref:Dihydroorotate dehydrogenase (quinone), mitochondrial n=1 Tax=Paulinella longichromatophora TaxID=1708747 RepID=A0A2H4ZP89_9EUKA|nr:dihydroorotate dehydrogenase [Paulinella longichromatophora]